MNEEFIKEVRRRVKHDPKKTLPWLGLRLYERFLARPTTLFDRSRTNIFTRDWDILLVLDACRTDLIEEVESEYDFLSNGDEITSTGSNSPLWMRRTFTDEHADEMAETAYVNANPHSEFELNAADFRQLDDVWKYAWDESLGTVPPRPVTDRAIATWREFDPDSMIVHYMQPHAPFVDNPTLGSELNLDRIGEKWNENIWELLQKGDISKEEVWTAYKDNLRSVLDDVELLLESVDAQKVVITADHGNAIGERGFYGHKTSLVDPVLRVPWYETTANKQNEYEPTQEQEVPAEMREVESQLSALGYK